MCFLTSLTKYFQHESCTVYTSSKKDISHIAIILKEDGAQDDDADETPSVAPRRAAAEKARVKQFYIVCLFFNLSYK